MTKRKSECSSYAEARDVSSGTTLWTKGQEEMYDSNYKERKVFVHRYVKWSDSTGLVKDVATKYESSGVKNLVSHNNKTWLWNEDIIRKFYSTLFVSSDLKEISFMVDNTRHVVTKEQFEEALDIKYMTGSIIIHDLSKQGKETVCSKRVCNLQPEVDLIQKINRFTLLPRKGNRNGCSDVSIRLANAIWKGEHFDVASFIFTEMHLATGNKNQLPYGPHICSLLRYFDYITDESIGEKCSPTTYTPVRMKKSGSFESVEASNVRLTKQVESLEASNVGLRKQMESLEGSNARLANHVKSLEAINAGLAKQVKSFAAIGKPLEKVVVQPEKPLENAEVQSMKPLEIWYTRRGGSRAPAGA